MFDLQALEHSPLLIAPPQCGGASIPGEDELAAKGAAVNRFLSTGQPLMANLPVRIRKLPA